MKILCAVMLALVIAVTPLTAEPEPELDMDFQLVETAALGQQTYRVNSTNWENMENGGRLSEGQEFSGLLSLENLLPLRSRMALVQGNFLRFEWEFAPNVLRQLEAGQ